MGCPCRDRVGAGGNFKFRHGRNIARRIEMAVSSNRLVGGLSGTLKFAVMLVLVVLTRLAPRPPNVEPVMCSMLPFARRDGKLAAFVFAFLSMLLLDGVQGRVGMWTLYTAVAYGVVGWLAAAYLQGRASVSRWRYAGFAAVGTIFYDAVTALMFGLQFRMPLELVVAGQIPFTLYHLAGNVLLAATVTPLLAKYVVDNPALAPAALPGSSPVQARERI